MSGQNIPAKKWDFGRNFAGFPDFPGFFRSFFDVFRGREVIFFPEIPEIPDNPENPENPGIPDNPDVPDGPSPYLASEKERVMPKSVLMVG